NINCIAAIICRSNYSMTEGSSKKQRCDRVVASHDLNRKPRFRWTVELHEMFVKAVNELGGPYDATPKNIVKLMDDEDITPEHIKSHLQVSKPLYACVFSFLFLSIRFLRLIDYMEHECI
uniref:Myb-like domain-containing protein n=1 Tax=Solanum lycopersicum TaxID=4081 RepID=A0A3Q7HE16_SOLLC